jgi:predicted membrane-bound mannosyltransferase
MFNLLEQIEELSGIDPGNRSMPVSVVAPDDNYWPLPWYLRRYDRVGWWSKLPEPLAGSVVVVATKVNASLEEKSGQAWIQAGMFELRPRYFVELYVEAGLWRRFLEARAAARR